MRGPLSFDNGASLPADGALPDLRPALAADHHAIWHCLQGAFPGASRDLFLSSLDDPFYEPRNRLLVCVHGRVAAHVHLTQRVMHVGPAKAPAAGVEWLGTAPEFRGRGFARRLLDAAEKRMRRDGAVLGMLHTQAPRIFQQAGWTPCARRRPARANARDLLSRLAGPGASQAEACVTIRPWRQVELPALMRLYQAQAATATGPWHRTEAFWRWLLSCRTFDQLLVAVATRSPFETYDPASEIEERIRAANDDAWASHPADAVEGPIVGYMAIKENRVLEIVVAPGCQAVADQLAIRACRETIERGGHGIAFELNSHDKLADLCQDIARGFEPEPADRQEICMLKLLDPAAMLRLLRPEIERRAIEAGIRRPVELGLAPKNRQQPEFRPLRVVITRRSVKLGANAAGRKFIRCDAADLTRLLVGRLDVLSAHDQLRLVPSSQLDLDLAYRIFPKLPWWRPTLDAGH